MPERTRGLFEPLALLLLAAAMLVNYCAFVAVDNASPTGDQMHHLDLAVDVYESLLESRTPLDVARVLYDRGTCYYPPMMYVVTAPFFRVLGPSERTALHSNTAFLVILLFSCWLLGRRLWGRAGGLLAAFLAVSTPAVLGQGPTYYQDVPMAALVMLHLALLHESDRFRRPWLSVAAGVALGLAMLTKPPAPLFVWPAWLLLAPAWGERRSWRNLALAVLAAVAVAGPWYLKFGEGVAQIVEDSVEPDSLRRFLGQPGHVLVGGLLVHAPALAANMAHVLALAPLVAAFLVQWLALPRDPSLHRGLPLLACLVAAGVALSLAPAYSTRYLVPLPLMMAVAAGWWGTLRRPWIGGPVALVLVLAGTVQTISWLPPVRAEVECPEQVGWRTAWHLYKDVLPDEAGFAPTLFEVRVPQTEADETDDVFRAVGHEETLVVTLCHSYPLFHTGSRFHGARDSVAFLEYGPSGESLGEVHFRHDRPGAECPENRPAPRFVVVSEDLAGRALLGTLPHWPPGVDLRRARLVGTYRVPSFCGRRPWVRLYRLQEPPGPANADQAAHPGGASSRSRDRPGSAPPWISPASLNSFSGASARNITPVEPSRRSWDSERLEVGLARPPRRRAAARQPRGVRQYGTRERPGGGIEPDQAASRRGRLGQRQALLDAIKRMIYTFSIRPRRTLKRPRRPCCKEVLMNQPEIEAAAQRASHFQEYQRSHGRAEYASGRETRRRQDDPRQVRTTPSDVLVRGLLDRGLLQAEDSAWLARPVPPLDPRTTFDRIEGMLLGLAIGDALGRPEGMPGRERRAGFGELRDYLPNRHTGQALGYPSDDTQLAFWTVEHLLAEGHLEPGGLARAFMESGRIFGIGRTVREAFRRLQGGVPWQEAGPDSAGNGALMRIAPVLLPYLRHPSPGLWSDALLAGMVTHNNRASNASCVAMVRVLWDLLSMQAPPDPSWWVQAWVEPAREIEGATRYPARAPRFSGWEGPLWRFVEEQVPAALARGLDDVDEAGWHSGAYLLETVPTVLFLLSRYGHDPEQALVRAATDTWDNDTVAALVGAAVGALHGRSALPRRWVEKHSGWIRLGDDGTIFRLLEQVRARFWGRS